MSTAVWTDSDFRIGELLSLLGMARTLLTFVFVERHLFLLSNQFFQSEFAEFDKADAGDGLHSPERFEGGCGGACVDDVDLDDGQSLTLWDATGSQGAGRICCASQGEVGDVEGVLAKNRADVTNDAGYVVVADGDQGAMERGFDVDIVVGEEAGRGPVQHGSRGAGIAFRGVQHKLEHRACTARDELPLVLLDADSAFRRDGCGINAVRDESGLKAIIGVGENPGDGGVADEVGFTLSDTAGVGDLDVFEVAGGGMGEELAEAFGHLDVGGQLDVLLVREGGDVDGVLDDAELEVVADLHGELDADGLLCLVGGARDVGGEEDVVEGEEG